MRTVSKDTEGFNPAILRRKRYNSIYADVANELGITRQGVWSRVNPRNGQEPDRDTVKRILHHIELRDRAQVEGVAA